jgi:hypothetical protein
VQLSTRVLTSGTTVTEFSKTFLVFYKWPDLTDVQGILTSTVLFPNTGPCLQPFLAVDIEKLMKNGST